MYPCGENHRYGQCIDKIVSFKQCNEQHGLRFCIEEKNQSISIEYSHYSMKNRRG